MPASKQRLSGCALFEGLEDRRLFVAYVWAAPAGGGWAVPANWAPLGVPTALDTATIALPGFYSVVAPGDISVTALTVGDGGAGGPGQQKLVVGGHLNVTGGTTVVANGRIEMSPAVGGTVFKTGAFALFGDGTFDLNDNDAIIGAATPRAVIEGYVKAARGWGLWTGPGLTSTTAKNSMGRATGLGVLGGADYIASHDGQNFFDGYVVAATNTLVKYTWYGDTDFNGKINADDYARIDAAFNNEVTQGDIGGWFNGDSDLNGKINFDDYALMDSSFNQQNLILRPGSPFSGGDDDHSAPISVIDELAGAAKSD